MTGFSHSTEDDIATILKHVWNKNYIRIFEVYNSFLLFSKVNFHLFIWIIIKGFLLYSVYLFFTLVKTQIIILILIYLRECLTLMPSVLYKLKIEAKNTADHNTFPANIWLT